MKTFYEGLFTYNNHINRQLVSAFLENQKKTSEKSIKLFNHILNAHEIWNSRILQKKNAFLPWDLHLPETYLEMEEKNSETSKSILNDLELSTVIQYSNFKGDPFTNTVGDILFHIVNHSTYHRGQIASDFKEGGLQPMVSDYIHYKR